MKTLLLGNGINRIQNDYSWWNLMNDLLGYAGVRDSVQINDHKPFPLLYEEMFLKRDATRISQKEIVLEITRLLKKIQPNYLHRMILDMDLSEIMTTNYDYNLELARDPNLDKVKHLKPVQGRKFSFHRVRLVEGKKIWHLHGERRLADSVLLGYDHYSGYLQHIRNYVTRGLDYKTMDLYKPLLKRIREGEHDIRTWVDHFFLSDIYILGLSLEFVEMHLWWILTFRGRLIHEQSQNPERQPHPIANRIVFVCPEFGGEPDPEESCDDLLRRKRQESVLQLLRGSEVEVKPIPVRNNDWGGFYEDALQFISKS